MPKFEIILFVKDQKRSRDFYATILQKNPILDVTGMTEFALSEEFKLGLMPENGIANILKNRPHPSLGNGIPRCELYVELANALDSFNLAIHAGATIVSNIQKRDWGHTVGYVSDFDGHIIAFAEKTME